MLQADHLGGVHRLHVLRSISASLTGDDGGVGDDRGRHWELGNFSEDDGSQRQESYTTPGA